MRGTTSQVVPRTNRGGALVEARDDLAEALALYFEDEPNAHFEAPIIAPIDIPA